MPSFSALAKRQGELIRKPLAGVIAVADEDMVLDADFKLTTLAAGGAIELADLSTWDREILQLADIVAYSVTECLVTGRPPQARSHLWAQIRHQLAIQWSTGAIEGGGLAIFPRPRKYPET